MDLKNNFHLTLKEVSSLEVCIWIDLDHPSQIYWGMEDVEIAFTAVFTAVEKERKAAVDDLSMWQLKPPGMKGKNIFDRMIVRRHVKYSDAKLIKNHNISDELNSIYPLKGRPQHQKDFMDINYAHITERKIMMDVGDGSNLKMAAKAKLDNLGNMRSHSQFVNDTSRL